MVRLAFSPYNQIWRSICTSESFRASTRVSPGFTLPRHSSPSFRSQHKRSCTDHFPKEHGWLTQQDGELSILTVMLMAKAIWSQGLTLPMKSWPFSRWALQLKQMNWRFTAPIVSCYFHFALGLLNPLTCACVKLLGPCFKTGNENEFSYYSMLVTTSVENNIYHKWHKLFTRFFLKHR